MITVEKATGDWLTMREATVIIECSPMAISRMVKRGLIRRRQVSSHRRYWREDVERIAAPPEPAA